MTLRQCSKCGEKKPATSFFTEKRGRDGLRYSCKSCDKARRIRYLTGMSPEQWAARKVTRQRHRQADAVYQRRYRYKWRARALLAHAKRRARDRGVLFELAEHVDSIQARIDKGYCELSGVPFDMGPGPRTFASPSIDRIDPQRGYVYSNVRVVCLAMNCALGNWGEAALLQVVTAWLNCKETPMGEQLQIQPTTTLPAAKQILPSIASLVKAQKSIPQMAEILGIDEPEVQIRLEAAGLLEAVMTPKQVAVVMSPTSTTVMSSVTPGVATPSTTAPETNVTEVAPTTPAVSTSGGVVSSVVAQLAEPTITDVLPQSAEAKPQEFVRRRGRSAAAQSQQAQSTSEERAQIGRDIADAARRSPYEIVPLPQVTQTPLVVSSKLAADLSDDRLALAIGKLALIARKVGVPAEQLIEWCKIVIQSETRT